MSEMETKAAGAPRSFVANEALAALSAREKTPFAFIFTGTAQGHDFWATYAWGGDCEDRPVPTPEHVAEAQAALVAMLDAVGRGDEAREILAALPAPKAGAL